MVSAFGLDFCVATSLLGQVSAFKIMLCQLF